MGSPATKDRWWCASRLHTAHELLSLRVTNTIAENKTPGEEGIGIKNVRERLAVQFEGRART